MRKTNLFYLDGNDSNFLTFSNYGEYLTGVCLSTNNKIYPSSFICLNLPFDNNDYSVDKFKKFLMCYYENKLAYMRDNYESKTENNAIYIHQEQVMALSYLFESIYLFFNKQKPEITYFGDIVEHDYNGTYSDSMCIIDFKRYLCGELSNPSDLSIERNTNEVISLYGWNDDNIGQSAEYTTNDEIENDNIKYNEDSLFDYLAINEGSSSKIEFNCVIPLFDINNLNYNQNNKQIRESNTFNISLNNKDVDNYDVYKYIPYGIWFSLDSDNPELHKIQLYRTNNNISQSWSLVISSKFSPYPYGLKITDKDLNSNITDVYTYAELLEHEAQLIKEYNNMLNKFNELSNEIQNMKNMFKSISALDIDKVRRDTQDMINNMQVYIDNALVKIDERFAQFAWENIDKHTANN